MIRFGLFTLGCFNQFSSPNRIWLQTTGCVAALLLISSYEMLSYFSSVPTNIHCILQRPGSPCIVKQLKTWMQGDREHWESDLSPGKSVTLGFVRQQIAEDWCWLHNVRAKRGVCKQNFIHYSTLLKKLSTMPDAVIRCDTSHLFANESECSEAILSRISVVPPTVGHEKKQHHL